MPNGEPYISQASVAAALDTLIYPSKTPEPNPLERLLVVDLFISDPSLPASENIREFALHEILVSLITNELIAIRAALNFPPLKESEKLEEAEQSLQIAGRSRGAELLLWTLLYYRYVRDELGFDQEQISELISVNPRSLRRYYQYALRLLTKRLLRKEWTARIEHHHQKLYAALPRGSPINLIGRDDLLEKAWNELASDVSSRLYITGAAGVGKTAFTEVLVQRLINADRVACVIWLDAPPSSEYVRHAVADSLPTTGLTSRDYFQRYPTALVLDNAESLLEQPGVLSELLREMRPAFVFLTSSVYTSLLEIDLHLPLVELEEAATFALIHDLAQTYLNDLPEDDVAPWIWQQIGGNPLAVKIATSLLAYEETGEIQVSASEQTIGKVFERLDRDEKLCWCALSLLPSASVEELTSLWYDVVNPASIGKLLRFFLAEQSGNRYSMTTSAAHFVRQQYAKNGQVQELYQQLFDELAVHAYRSPEVVEQILLAGWFSPDEQLEWIENYWRSGLERSHFAPWCAIFEALPTLSQEMMMAYGVCLRRAGRWDLAHQILQQALHQSGRKGDFATQRTVLVELAILARLRGKYEEAYALLNQAELSNKFKDNELFQLIQIERSQIALDKEDGAEALELLREVDQTIYTLILESESYLLLGYDEDCRMIAYRALERSKGDRRVEASLYTLIARSYEKTGQYELASSYFALALNILEPSGDISAIARAEANLGAVLLDLGKSQQGQDLLERAIPILLTLGDKVGHQAALHNQRLALIYRMNFN